MTIRDTIQQGEVRLKHILTDEKVAYILTKPLSKEKVLILHRVAWSAREYILP